MWIQSNTYEDYTELKDMVGNFEILSQFNINIKWVRLKILLYEYSEMITTDDHLNKAKDIALELKSIDPYLGYIAWTEVYAASGDFK